MWKIFLQGDILSTEAGVGSFWVFGFFLGSVVRRNLGTNIVRISVSMIKLSSRRRIWCTCCLVHFLFWWSSFHHGGEFDALVVLRILLVFLARWESCLRFFFFVFSFDPWNDCICNSWKSEIRIRYLHCPSTIKSSLRFSLSWCPCGGGGASPGNSSHWWSFRQLQWPSCYSHFFFFFVCTAFEAPGDLFRRWGGQQQQLLMFGGNAWWCACFCVRERWKCPNLLQVSPYSQFSRWGGVPNPKVGVSFGSFLQVHNDLSLNWKQCRCHQFRCMI